MSDLGGRRTEGGGRDRFDLAVDQAVRDILDVEQPADFTRRVMARIDDPAIDNPSVASGFSRKIFWVGAPLAAAAIVVLAVLLPREQVQPQAPAPVTIATVQPPSLPLTEATFEAGSGKPEAGSRQPRNVRADRVVAAAAFAPASADIAPGIQPLKAIDPIQITPLTQESIAPAPIEFRPLSTITEVQIAPLNPPDRRN